MKRLSKEEALARAIRIHGKKYDFSLFAYSNLNKKSKVICKLHGVFITNISNLIYNKCGCHKCSKRLTFLCSRKEIIKRARGIHGSLYTYSKFVYKNFRTKSKVTCKIHGDFMITPDKFVFKKRGCNKCAGKISASERRWLNSLNIKSLKRQFFIKIDNFRFHADGYDPITNTVYEFLGNYWHGNPKVFKKNHLNKVRNKTFGQLYNETMNKKKLLKKHGYNVVYMWEKDYERNISNKRS